MRAGWVLWLGLTAGMVQAEPLGRLFYTPEQRALLDNARKTMPMQTGEAAAAQSPQDYTLKGVVTRSDGQRSVWLNGQVQYGRSSATLERNQAQIALPGGSVKLKVGQSIDPGSGHVTESYRRPLPEPPAVKPPAPGKPAGALTPKPSLREDEPDAEQANP